MIKQYFWKTKEGSLQNTGCGNVKMQSVIEGRLSTVTLETKFISDKNVSILSETLFKGDIINVSS